MSAQINNTDVASLNEKMAQLIEYVPTTITTTILLVMKSTLLYPIPHISKRERERANTNQKHRAFDAHPQMQPPNPHPTIFFLRDFVKNTHEQLKKVDGDKFAAGDQSARDAVQEVVGRNQFASLLLNDSSGKLSLMTGSDPSNPVDFGPDVKAKARALSEA